MDWVDDIVAEYVVRPELPGREAVITRATLGADRVRCDLYVFRDGGGDIAIPQLAGGARLPPDAAYELAHELARAAEMAEQGPPLDMPRRGFQTTGVRERSESQKGS